MTDDNKPPMLDTVGNVTARTPSPLVIIATYGTGGDMLPFVTLTQGLHERGHRVLMLVPGFQEAVVQAAGVPYQTFGIHEEGKALLGDPDLRDERKAWGAIWKCLAPHLGAMRNLIQHLPTHETCVVLSHPILVPMAALARSVRPDLRIAAAYLAPSNLCSSHDMVSAGPLHIPPWVPPAWLRIFWRLIHKWFHSVMLPSLNAARVQYKLPPVPNFFEHLLKRQMLLWGCSPRGSHPCSWTGLSHFRRRFCKQGHEGHAIVVDRIGTLSVRWRTPNRFHTRNWTPACSTLFRHCLGGLEAAWAARPVHHSPCGAGARPTPFKRPMASPCAVHRATATYGSSGASRRYRHNCRGFSRWDPPTDSTLRL